MASSNQEMLKLIEQHPIGDGLVGFRDWVEKTCRTKGISCSADSLLHFHRQDFCNLILLLVAHLRVHKMSKLLPSKQGNMTMRFQDDLLTLVSTITTSKDFNFKHVIPLLQAALKSESEDSLIWLLARNAVDAVIQTPTPSPYSQSIAPPAKQTPCGRSTSGIVNSREYRSDVDMLLKHELRSLYVDHPHLLEVFFGSVADLGAISKAVFLQCTQGQHPLFNKGWKGWPLDAEESHVLAWFRGIVPKLEAFVGDRISPPAHQRKLLTQPKEPVQGSAGKRSLDIGFIEGSIGPEPNSTAKVRSHWSQIVVPGELKSSPTADQSSNAWIDIATYAREVFSAQPSRRFVLGFTLCGHFMRIWEFDRLGAIASQQFNVNSKAGGLRFVTAVLGFLFSNKEGLGYDPTILESIKGKSIEIQRDGHTETLVLDQVMHQSRCIYGRGTTCWKAHLEEDPHTPLVVKDSWQYTTHNEEGQLLKEVTAKGVVNVSRHYHHETVRVGDAVDDIQKNLRKGLDLTKAKRHQWSFSDELSDTGLSEDVSRGEESARAGSKRRSSRTSATLPPSKRLRSAAKNSNIDPMMQPNRMHRRVIVMDYGIPIYKAKSRAALLYALEGCISGHESLFQAGFLHRDISMHNLLIKEKNEDDDDDDPYQQGFLIDLDMAIRVAREPASGAQEKTGTRAFMAIGVLEGQQHSFMHDLESFFWVVFWVCIHYNGPDDSIGSTRYDHWNFANDEQLSDNKFVTIVDDDKFHRTLTRYFTPYYKPLIPWVEQLREVVFPQGRAWKTEDRNLYSKMRGILREAREFEEATSL